MRSERLYYVGLAVAVLALAYFMLIDFRVQGTRQVNEVSATTNQLVSVHYAFERAQLRHSDDHLWTNNVDSVILAMAREDPAFKRDMVSWLDKRTLVRFNPNTLMWCRTAEQLVAGDNIAVYIPTWFTNAAGSGVCYGITFSGQIREMHAVPDWSRD